MAEKVLAAMSGGVDSSVAAFLLDRDGYDVTGAMLKLFENETVGAGTTDECLSLKNKGAAERVAERLDIPFYVYNCTEKFRREVMEYFVAEYERGRTPNPCVVCNRTIKFGALMERAHTFGCRKTATGHYARVEKYGSRYLLKKGADASKDQSYALFMLTQEQLAETIFPLGGLTKDEVRETARLQGFESAEGKESQDICFVPDGDFAAFIRQFSENAHAAGEVVDGSGRLLGRHNGIAFYTVGQRRGLGISAADRLYVRGIDVAENRVILGSDAELYGTKLIARGINLIAAASLEQDTRVTAKIRYGRREFPATARQTDANELTVTFDSPQRAITRGQFVVLYDGDTVVGGGAIDWTE